MLIEGVRSADGREFRASLLDVTELRRTEERARESQVETQRLLEQSERSRRVLLSAVEDVKASEVALRASEAIFSNFMEFSPIYVFFKDREIRALRLSRNYEQLLGKPMEELIGKNMEDLFPSALARSIVADDKRVLAEGKAITVEEELDGRYFQDDQVSDPDRRGAALSGRVHDRRHRTPAYRAGAGAIDCRDRAGGGFGDDHRCCGKDPVRQPDVREGDRLEPRGGGRPEPATAQERRAE